MTRSKGKPKDAHGQEVVDPEHGEGQDLVGTEKS